MDNSTLQAQLADYISACAFETFTHPDSSEQVQVYIIHASQAFSKPLLEISLALKLDLAEITEIDEMGSVQELLVKNHSNKYLLIYEGTLLRGAKQNRMVNATLLLPPLSRFIIPASCVEQGRWHRTSREFKSSAYNAPSFLRKNIHASISRFRDLKGDQGQVWKDIREYSRESKLSNASYDFEDIYHRSDKKASVFPQGLSLPAAAGVFVQAGGESALDFVANEEAFAAVMPRIIPGYEYPAREKQEVLPDNPGQVLAHWIRQGKCFFQPSAAAGTDVRIETPKSYISALVVEEEVVSMSMMSR